MIFGRDVGRMKRGEPTVCLKYVFPTWFLAESLHHDLYLCERLVSS